MFTGLIEHLATLVSRRATATGMQLNVRCDTLDARDVKPGDSVAIDGCCLTVVREPGTYELGSEDSRGCELAFDVIPQTLALTTLGSLREGDTLHLETALTLASKLGGHLVQGHVDCVGKVLGIQSTDQWRVRVGVPASYMQAIIPQGSVSLAGVSLTIAACDWEGCWLEVALIPTTLAKTKLATLLVGDGINVECDMIAKQVAYVAKRMHEVRASQQTKGS